LKSRRNLIYYLLAVIIVAVFYYPFIWCVSTSFKGYEEYYTREFYLIPRHPTLEHIFYDLELYGIQPIINSLIITSIATLLVIVITLLASYGNLRLGAGGGGLPYMLLMLRASPAISSIIPLFILFKYLGLIDTYVGMILLYTVFNFPLSFWLLSSFISDIPRDIEDAAMIDGYPRWKVLLRFVVPQITSGLIATAILTFIFIWSEFLFAITMTRTVAKPLTVTLQELCSPREIKWGEVAFYCFLATLPVLILIFIIQKYLVRGMTFGVVK